MALKWVSDLDLKAQRYSVLLLKRCKVQSTRVSTLDLAVVVQSHVSCASGRVITQESILVNEDLRLR